MKSANIVGAVALFSIASLLACSTATARPDIASVAPPENAPYARWLYGLDGSRLQTRSAGLRSGETARYGSPADGLPYDHEVSLQPDTRSVTVAHNETVRFVTPHGEEFRWKFDTPRTVVSLARIAPPEVSLASNVAVFVTGDPDGSRG